MVSVHLKKLEFEAEKELFQACTAYPSSYITNTKVSINICSSSVKTAVLTSETNGAPPNTEYYSSCLKSRGKLKHTV